MSSFKEDILPYLIVGVVGVVVAIGLVKFLTSTWEQDNVRYQEKCNHIAKLAGGKQATIDANRDCYFVKDGKLEIVE